MTPSRNWRLSAFRSNKERRTWLGLLATILILSLSALTQQSGVSATMPFAADTKALVAAGKVENNVYSNPHAGFLLRLPRPPCDAKLNTQVDLNRGYAVLLDCQHVVQGWRGMYTLTIFTDSWANYPTLTSAEQYVRSLRHMGEKDPALKTVESETPQHFAGLEFSQTILSNKIPAGAYYEGLSCTHFRAYALCFKAEASTVESVRALVNLQGTLEIQKTEPGKHP